METIKHIAEKHNINKCCINGIVYDVRGNNAIFNKVPIKYEVMENSIYNEAMLFAYTR